VQAAIEILDQVVAAARDDVDFIKRYIFPGCCIPSVTALAQAMTASSDLRIVHLDDIGPHYATTLARWRENLVANIDKVRALGYPDTFIRMWEFYLCYCEAGFAERALGDVQMLLTKPRSRRSAAPAARSARHRRATRMSENGWRALFRAPPASCAGAPGGHRSRGIEGADRARPTPVHSAGSVAPRVPRRVAYFACTRRIHDA